jgi:hypothetical protein
MAAGAFIFPQKAKLNFLEGATGLLKNGSANYRLALFTSALVPDDANDEVLADISADEIANGNGYTTGGIALANVTLNQAAGVVTFDCDPAVWSAGPGSIPAWRYGYVYYLGTLNSKVNPLVGHFLGDSAPADIPATTVGNDLTVTPNVNGILSAT